MDLESAKTKGKKLLRRVLIAGVLLAIVGVAGDFLFTLKFSYSTGERVGFVQKLSKRGWLCKTNEGELSIVNLPGQPAQVFDFSVPDDKVSAQIESFAGHRVEIQYEQHKGVPSSCFGETEYFVVGVKKAE